MNDRVKLNPQVIIQLLFIVVLVPFLPLLITQRWGWWEAWAFAILGILGFVGSRVLVTRRNPDLIAERGKGFDHADTESWDRVLAPLVGVGSAAVPLVAGLDVRFGGLDPVPLWGRVAALLLTVAGYALASYALIENRFFSGVVRIQTDRGQHVVTGGPYRWMRHPGYAGAVLTYVAWPFLLQSFWALVPSVLIIAALVVRTHLEDRTLQARLPGYREYARRVRDRLLPGVW